MQLLILEVVTFCHLGLSRGKTAALYGMERWMERFSGEPGRSFTCKKGQRKNKYAEGLCAVTCQIKGEMVSFTKSRKGCG